MNSRISLISIMSITLFLGACGKDSPTYSLLPTGQTFVQSKSTLSNELDILWVVDNSGSMQPLQQTMTNNFTSFISNFQSKNYDFHMAVTTTEAYKSEAGFANDPSYSKFSDGIAPNTTGIFLMLPTTPNLNTVFVNNASLGANGSGDERAFSSLRDALNSSQNSGFLRTTSFLAVIILSDEDDFSSASRIEDSWVYQNGTPDHDYNYSGLDTVNSYVSYLDGLTATTGATRRWNASAITVLDQTCYNSHVGASPTTIIGQRYVQLAGLTQGITGSVCDATYATSLANIATQIATLSTQFFLDKTPIPSTIAVTVNSVPIAQDPNNGWQYVSSTNSIQFHGTAIPPQSASISVNFVPSSI